MTAAELKASILDRAVRGLLVPQREEEMFEKFEGFERFEKSTVENPPYDLPRGWVWVRLGCLVTVISGTSYKSHDVIKSGIRIFRGGNIQNGDVLYLEDDTFLPECFLDSEKTIREGDVLIVASTGSKAVIGKPGFVNKTDSKTQIGAFLRIVRPLEKKFIPYIWLIFKSEYYRQHIRGVVQGMNINNVKNEHLTEFPIPLPPLAEQKRIVAKIEELMPLVEEYGKAEAELTALNENFPTTLRKSILQHAVEGRLTARWRKEVEVEETAADLLEKIAAEKKRLLAEGKIKKQKPLPPITEEEKPFPIPDSWAWVRLGDVCSKIGAGATPKGGANVYVSQGIKLLREQNIHDDGLHLDNVVFITKEINDAKPGSQVRPKDILVNITGASIGRNSLVPDDFDIANVNQHVLIVRLINPELRFYIHECLLSPLMLNLMYGKQTGDKPGLSAEKVVTFPIPLPPLAEQKAIVARVEELLGLVDELKA